MKKIAGYVFIILAVLSMMIIATPTDAEDVHLELKDSMYACDVVEGTMIYKQGGLIPAGTEFKIIYSTEYDGDLAGLYLEPAYDGGIFEISTVTPLGPLAEGSVDIQLETIVILPEEPITKSEGELFSITYRTINDLNVSIDDIKFSFGFKEGSFAATGPDSKMIIGPVSSQYTLSAGHEVPVDIYLNGMKDTSGIIHNVFVDGELCNKVIPGYEFKITLSNIPEGCFVNYWAIDGEPYAYADELTCVQSSIGVDVDAYVVKGFTVDFDIIVSYQMF